MSDRIVEYGDKINFVDETKTNTNIDYKVYIEDKEITDYTFSKLGQVELTEVNCAYYNDFFNRTKKVEAKKIITYTVKDTKKPIIDGVQDKEIIVGDSIDLKEGITAKDEIDGDLDIIIEGEVNTNIVGEYNIKVIAKDRNDNIEEKTYIVRVKNKPEINNESSKSLNNKSTNNSLQSTERKKQEEQSRYKYETYGNRIYFEEERGTDGNYSEKFSW